MRAPLKNENIKVLTSSRLIDYMPRRPTHFAKRMAADNRVVNLCSSSFRKKHTPGVIPEMGWATECFYRWPLSRIKAIRDMNENAYHRFLRRRIGNEDIVWAYEPFSIEGYLTSARKFLVYEMCDDTSAFFSHHPPLRDLTLRREETMCRAADIVITISDYLRDQKKHLNANFHVVRNGADFPYFSQARTLPCDPRDELANIPRPIVGYHGAISPWVDFELIDRTAAAMKDVQFVFIGRIHPPCFKDVEDMKKAPNVFFLGERKYSDLVHFLKYFDVAIIPFKMTQLILSVNPIKMYEYLAAGKPVLSTPLPEVKRYEESGVVETAHDADEFAAAIAKLLELKNNEDLVQKRIALASENSWEARYSELQGLVVQSLDARSQK